MSNPYSFGVYDYAAKTQFKYQTLMQEYQELQKEAFVTNRKLTLAKQRKLMLAAEVRFLRRRYKLLVKMKALNPSQEQELVQPSNSLGRNKISKNQNFSRKEAAKLRTLPPIPKVKHTKRRNSDKEAAVHSASTVRYQHHNQIIPPDFGMNNKGRTNISGETLSHFPNSIFHINVKESMNSANDAALRKLTTGFDLNRADISLSGKDDSLPSQIPILDLHEASTEDVEIPIDYKAIELGEAKMHNDLKLSVCRDDREASSYTKKRKISWKDPVALIV